MCVLPVYAAGKAATSGVPSIYAPSTYAYLSPAKTPPPATMIPMGPVYNGYSGDFDKNSSGELWWDQKQLRQGRAKYLGTKGSGAGRKRESGIGEGAGNAGLCSRRGSY